MNGIQAKRIVKVVKANPGISLSDLDAKFGGQILGVGDIQGITEEDFDAKFIGEDKPLKKVDD